MPKNTDKQLKMFGTKYNLTEQSQLNRCKSESKIKYQKRNTSKTGTVKRLRKKERGNSTRYLKQTATMSREEYLRQYDDSHGFIDEQKWAKKNMSNFHKRMQMQILNCCICDEAWPVKCKYKSKYMCSRCKKVKIGQ